MDFKQLAQQYKHELLDKVVPFWLENRRTRSLAAISPASTAMVLFLIPINSFGYKAVRFGCFPSFTIRWKSVKSGWIAPFRGLRF